MGKVATVAVVLLFAVPFGGVGAWATWSIGSTLHDAWRARQWVQVPATVEAASLKESTDSEGDDTYLAEGRYRYVVDGRPYESSRLGLSKRGGSDNIGSWHHEVHERLAQARAAGRPVDVWVNPANPAESVFVREVRWGEILFLTPFSLAFGGVGVGGLVFALRLLRTATPSPGEGARQALHPVAAAMIAGRPGRESPARFLWVFAFFWNALSWPIAILALDEVRQSGELAGLVVLLFPLVGLGLLWAATASSWRSYSEGRRGADSRSPPSSRLEPGSAAARAARALFDEPSPAFDRPAPPSSTGGRLDLPPSVADVEEKGGTLTIRYKARRRLGIAVFMLVMGLVVTVVAVAFFLSGESMLPVVAAFAVGGLLDFGAVAFLMGRLEVRAKPGVLEVERAGITGRRSWRLRREAIREIRTVLSYKLNEVPHYAIVADAGGEQVPLGNSIRGEALAQGVARRIAAAIGLD